MLSTKYLYRRLLLGLVFCGLAGAVNAQSLTVTPTSDKGVTKDGVYHVLANKSLNFDFTFNKGNDKKITGVKESSFSFDGETGSLSAYALSGELSISELYKNTGKASATNKTFNSSVTYYTGDSITVQVDDSTQERRWDAKHDSVTVKSNDVNMRVWDTPECKLTGSDQYIYSDPIVSTDLSWTVSYSGGYDKGWKFEWIYTYTDSKGEHQEKSYDSTFKMPAYTNETSSMQTITINVKAYNYAPDGSTQWNTSFDKTIRIYVKSGASVIINKDAIIGYEGEQKEVSAYTLNSVKGSTWTFEWTLDGNVLQTTENTDTVTSCKFTLPDVEQDGYRQMNLRLKSSNDKSPFVANGDVNITVYSYSHGRAEAVSNNPVDVYAKGVIALKVNTPGGYPEGWTYKWMEDGKEIATTTTSSYNYSPNYTGSSEVTHTYTVEAINKIGDTVGCDTIVACDTLTIWPACKFPSEITLTDNENANNPGDKIREGNDFVLSAKGYTGGYTGGKWTEEWTCGGKAYSDSPTITAQVASSGRDMNKDTQITAKVVIKSYGPDGTVWDDTTLTKTITVYRKPVTPLYLDKMGSKTGTVIVTMPSDFSDADLVTYHYYLVFGYNDDSAYPKHDVVCQDDVKNTDFWDDLSSDVYSRSDLWVCSMWKYDDGTLITSDKCYLSNGDNSVTKSWDGSFYDWIGSAMTTRGVADSATSISGMEADGAARSEGIFSLNGERLPAMKKGINIVRMSDGSVRKVLLK